jgi:hypothetical protein
MAQRAQSFFGSFELFNLNQNPGLTHPTLTSLCPLCFPLCPLWLNQKTAVNADGSAQSFGRLRLAQTLSAELPLLG